MQGENHRLTPVQPDENRATYQDVTTSRKLRDNSGEKRSNRGSVLLTEPHNARQNDDTKLLSDEAR
jgi:hypothetical protein